LSKIVLTHGYFLYEDEKEQEIMRPYPTLGLLYISAYLKEHRQSVALLDSTFSSKEDWLKQIENEQPEIIAFYTNLMTKINVIENLKAVKAKFPHIKTIVGGPDVTYNLKNYLSTGFDFAVIGEGEQTMLELCKAILNNTSFEQIGGIAYLKEGKVIQTNAREKIKVLADLPFPDRKGLEIENYLSVWKKHHGKRTLNISTQRGCPYTCKWCSTAVYGQSYRRNSPQRVVEEILQLKKEFNVEALWFVDDVFTVSHKWIEQLHAEFQKNNLFIPFECITRAERLNEVVLHQLKEMGCFRIWIGAESGSQKIIDKMDRRVELKTVQEMMNKTQELGMEAGTFIMVGYPEENHEDILATYEHIRACNPDLLTITKAYPIKGTGLYTEIEGTITQPANWEKSTDRDIKIKLPYTDSYYENAIRYLVNGWKAKKDNSIKHALKSKIALTLMKLKK